MKKNKYLILTVPIIILLLLGMIFHSQYTNNPRFWYCSPSESRGGDLQTWEKTINPELPVSQIDEEFFDQFTISSDQEKFTIDFPNKKPNENPFAFELRELSPGETLKVGSETLKFPIIGVGYRRANQNEEEFMNFSFYDSQLQLMSEDQVVELQKREIIIYNRASFPPIYYPRVLFIVEHQGIENIIINNFSVYDGRTHHLLNNGGGYRNRDTSWWYETSIPAWHNCPIDVVVDISFGQIQPYDFAPEAGQGFKTENFECRLLDIFENVSNILSNTNTLYRTPMRSDDVLGQSFYFICQPQALHMPVTFELFNKEGNQLRTFGGGTSTYTHRFGLRKPLEEVALIRANYRTKRCRIIFHLPYIPDLPEQNVKVNNLFDVYVPYVAFERPVNIQQFLQKVLQLRDFSRTGQIPVDSIDNMSFPMDFSDVTVRDITEIYASSGNLNVDIENNSLELKYPLPLLTKLKQFFQKIFQKQ